MGTMYIRFEKIARRRLNIPKQKGWDNQYVNKTHKWGIELLFSLI